MTLKNLHLCQTLSQIYWSLKTAFLTVGHGRRSRRRRRRRRLRFLVSEPDLLVGKTRDVRQQDSALDQLLSSGTDGNFSVQTWWMKKICFKILESNSIPIP